MNDRTVNPRAAETVARATAQGLGHVQLLTVREVSELLAISVLTTWRYTKAERIPQPVRLSPSVIRWRLRDIERFLGASGNG